MSGRGRPLAARVLVVLACVVLVLALVAGYVRLTAINSDQFANRATAALRDDSVKSLIAQKITDEVVLKNEADLIAARPIIESVAEEIVGRPRLHRPVPRRRPRRSRRRLQPRQEHGHAHGRRRRDGPGGRVRELRPSLAKQLEDSGRVSLVKRDVGSASASLARLGKTIRVLALILLVLFLLLAGGAIVVSLDRRRTVVELGIGSPLVGVLLVVAYSILRSVAIDQVDGRREPIRGRRRLGRLHGRLPHGRVDRRGLRRGDRGRRRLPDPAGRPARAVDAASTSG